ncbi:MAG: glycosyltransferase [Treponema sp.]|nr:glycosyltransferase [Treponema sp.]
MNNIPLLSICIPTYNRAENLKNCIESIIKQDVFNPDNIEIVISDNCSTDNTKEIAMLYTDKYSNIHYFCNEKNVTMENFPIVLSEANGELAKLTNDTTIFAEGSLHKIIEIIKSNLDARPTIFFLNSGKGENCYCEDLEDFLYNVSFFTTWIGGFSLWTEDRVGIRNNLYACDTFLWQVPVILNAAIKHKKSLVIKDRLFKNIVDAEKRVGAYNNSLYTIFYKNYFSLLDEIFEKNPISPKCYNWLRKDLLYNFFSNWLVSYKLQKHKPKEEKTLTSLVFSEYKKEKYFIMFYLYYLLKLSYRVVKM